MVEVLRLHLLLVGLAVVEVVEVGDDDGHGQGDREHAGDRAQAAHYLAPHSDRPVTCGRGGREREPRDMHGTGEAGRGGEATC